MAHIGTGTGGPLLSMHRKMALGVNGALGRVEVLALFPLVVLTAAWFGFDDLAMVTTFTLSILLAIGTIWGQSQPASAAVAGALPMGRAGILAQLDRISGTQGRDTACILLQIDDWPRIAEMWGHDTSEDIMARLEERLQTALRQGDRLTRLGDARFGIALGAMPAARLGLRETVVSRLAGAVAEPLAVRGATLRLAASIGHTSLIRRSLDPADATLKAAEAALSDAVLHGPGAIRAYAPGMGRDRVLQSNLSAEVSAALHSGAISAWFQPQICARTGVLTGMETLARWDHPKQGLLSPREFLAAVDASGQMPVLGQTLMHQALKALAGWDAAKARVPGISLNFSVQELRDADLPQALQAQMTRYGITPDRVTLEITDMVAAQTEDDSVLATLTALRDAGHPMNLDSFGLGPVSMLTLQRFDIARVKIDRSFILGIDGEAGRQRAVTAIVAMAKALGIDTLAKGVETPQEMQMLTTLGCDHLQGFRIARPMRGDSVAGWARARIAEGKTIRLEDRRHG